MNILIAHIEGRKKELLRCLSSIKRQAGNFPYRVLIAVDFEDHDYIPDWCEVYKVGRDPDNKYHWYTYYNVLKALPMQGWFICMLDIDAIDGKNILALLHPKLDRQHVAVFAPIHTPQNTRVPSRWNFHRHTGLKDSEIHLSCLILHTSYRMMLDLQPVKQGDIKWVRGVILQMNHTYFVTPVTKTF